MMSLRLIFLISFGVACIITGLTGCGTDDHPATLKQSNSVVIVASPRPSPTALLSVGDL